MLKVRFVRGPGSIEETITVNIDRRAPLNDFGVCENAKWAAVRVLDFVISIFHGVVIVYCLYKNQVLA